MTDSEEDKCKAKKKVVVVLGTTAVGKTKFSIELALAVERERGVKVEIIGCDSVQVYRGLNVLSDAVTETEAKGVIHHLIATKEPHEAHRVHDFVAAARQCIDEIHGRGNLPLLTGGTLYYMEALLFHTFCTSALDSEPKCDDGILESALYCESKSQTETDIKSDDAIIDASANSCKCDFDLGSLSKEEMWQRLLAVDPNMARKYHANDSRRVARSLQVFYSTGTRHSEHLRKLGALDSTQLLYQPLVFWLDASNAVIDDRIERRLVVMEADGVFEEIASFSDWMQHTYGCDALQYFDTLPLPKCRIWMVEGFGFKAFLPWLKWLKAADGKRQSTKQSVRRVCLERYALDTKRYARKQKRWLRNRIEVLQRFEFLFKFDTSDKSQFESTVIFPAVAKCAQFLEGTLVPKCGGQALESREEAWMVEWFSCDCCGKAEIRGRHEWKQHLESKMHKKRKGRKKHSLMSSCSILQCWHQFASF